MSNRIPMTTCLLFLLCMIGCAKQHTGLSGSIRFEVDGIKYHVTRYADVDQRGQVASSSLVVQSDSSYFSGGFAQYDSQRGTTIVTIKVDKGDVVAKTDTLYFLQEGKIEFEKNYRDLGIDASQLNADLGDMLDYLQPILEKLIRENVNSL